MAVVSLSQIVPDVAPNPVLPPVFHEAATANGAQRVTHSPSRQQMAELASSLLELCALCETELRALTAMQRSLERVRGIDGFTAEADLLLGEMSRQLRELEEQRDGAADHLRAAGRHLGAVRGDLAPRTGLSS